jgi:ribosomal protein L6P/L9E
LANLNPFNKTNSHLIHMKSSTFSFLFFLIFFIATLTSCKKETTNTPSGPPTITGISTTIAGIGYEIIIQGTNFSNTAGANSVTINGIAATVVSVSPTQLLIVATNASGTGKIAVTANGNTVISSFDITIKNLSVTTLAGNGGQGALDGQALSSNFNSPWGVALDANGNMYIADSYNNKIRKLTAAGVVSTFAGTGALGNNDGAAATATFNLPFGIVVDKNGNVYVSDIGSDNIRKITPGAVVSTFAGSTVGATGSADGLGTSATFKDPLGLAIDADNNLYVADAANNEIREIAPDGTVTTLAGNGVAGATNGTTTTATFNSPLSVAVDAGKNVYVTEQNNFDVREISSAGEITTVAGSGVAGSQDGIGTAASFNYPVGIVSDGSGNLYVTDNGYGTIRIITSTGEVATLAGNGSQTSSDGSGFGAGFNDPLGIAIDTQGTLYVVDNGSNKIRKITVQ